MASSTINTRLLDGNNNNANNANANVPNILDNSHVDLEAPAASIAGAEAVESLIEAAGRDSSPEAKRARARTALRAICGELLATFIFMYCVCSFGIQVNRINPAVGQFAAIVGPLFQGFIGIAVIYTFADISGAHFNPAVKYITPDLFRFFVLSFF
jgi:hypothetical protein